MATEVGRGIVPIEADASNLAKDIDAKVKAQHGDIGKVFGDLGKVAGAALVGAAGLAVAAGAGLAKLGESFDEAFDQIRVTTGKTGQALADLQDDFKAVATSVPVSFGDASTAVATLNQKLGLSGKPLQDAAEQMLNLSRITKTDLQSNIASVTGTFNQWGVTADQQHTKLDELYRISQQTGVSFSTLSDSLAQGGAQFRSAGLSFEESGALIGLLAKNGLDAGAVIPALGKAMATAAKEGKPAAEVFHDTFDAIKNAKNDTKGAQEAIEVFGAKAGPKFAELIRQGKLSYEDFATAISAGGDTINGAAQQTDDWREKLKLLMNKVFVLLEPLASKVFGAIGTAIDKVTPFLQKIAGWLGDKIPKAFAAVRQGVDFFLGGLTGEFTNEGSGVLLFLNQMGMKVGEVVDWFRAAWPEIKKIAVAVFDAIRVAVAYFIDVIVPKIVEAFKAAFGWLMDHKEVLIGVAAAIAVGLGALFASWVAGAVSAAAATLAAAAPFIAVGAAIAAVVAGVLWAYKHVKWFHDAVDAVGRFLRDVVWPILKDVFGWLRDHVPPIVRAIIRWFRDDFLPAVKVVFGWLRDNVPPILQGIAHVFEAVVGWVRDHWEQIKSIVMTAVNIVRGIIEGVVAVVTTLWQTFGDDIVGAARAAWDFITGIVQAGVDIVVGIFDFFRDLFTGKWGKLWGDIRDVLVGIWEAIKAIIQNAVDAVILIVETAWDALKLAAELVWDAIKLVITGAWDAIKVAAELVWDGIKLAITTVWDTIKSTASTVWEGIKTAVMTPIDALTDLIGAVWDGIKSAAGTAWDAIKQVVLYPISLISVAIMGVKDLALSMWDGLTDVVSKVWGGIKDLIGGIIDGIGTLVSGLWDGIKSGARTAINGLIDAANVIIQGINDVSPFDDIPKIHHVTFHTGGTVPGVAGTEVPALLLAGETVRTPTQEQALQQQLAMAGAATSGGGGTFVYAPNIISPDHQVGKIVGDAIQQYRRFNGRLPWDVPGNAAFS